MSEHDPANEHPRPAEVWVRFMAAALSAAPHAPADKLATTADEAFAEYQRRAGAGGFAVGDGGEPNAASGATATPFVARAEGDDVTYEATAEAPDDKAIDSPFRPPVEGA
jgi:hypothetical protein